MHKCAGRHGTTFAGPADNVERAAQLPAAPRGPLHAEHMVAPADGTPAACCGRAGPRHVRYRRCNQSHGLAKGSSAAPALAWRHGLATL